MTCRGRIIRGIASLLLIACGSACLCGALLAAPPPSEYDVKAAFLLNFTRFIEWPQAQAASGAPFFICVLGEDPFGKSLDNAVAGEESNGRRIVVRRIARLSGTCDVLFVSRSEKGVSRILAETGPGVLTVGESDDFLREGGMIAFTVENRRVRFDANLSAAAKASLQISSKLLNVARSVER